MSLDPSTDYSSNTNQNYYTLWHCKRGQWVSYGYIPTPNPIHYGRARPFQIKLESDKWGLKSGWHIIHVYSYSPQGINQPTYKKILRLRHVGQRIPQDQLGYLIPNYFDDNWEILGERTFSAEEYGNWYSGETIRTRGVYRPIPGIVYDSDTRIVRGPSSYWEEGDSVGMYCWDGDFYSFRSYSPGDGIVPDYIMHMLATWPGTSNRIMGGYYQEYDEQQAYRRPFSFNPSSRQDTFFWDVLGVDEASDSWKIPDSRDDPLGTQAHWIYTSNFWFIACAFNPGLYTFSRYLMFQGRSNWRTLNNMVWDGTQYNPPSLANSIWDWEWDCSCAEENMAMAYVRRKSDGSIWRFRNWNPATNIYTDFINLDPRPVTPTPGQEYMTFFINGPPIPGNETWNTLMILR